HLNYSFGYIYHNEKGFDRYPGGALDYSYTNDENLIGTIYLDGKAKSDLSKISELKKRNKDLKVSLSLGGYCGRGFSDAALTKESRAKTVNAIAEVVKKYGLDGIDIDWELPVNGGWDTILARPEDKENYTLFLQDLKSVLGKDKLVTIAAGVGSQYINEYTEFRKVADIVDYIYMMTYEYAFSGPKYNSNLYSSSNDQVGKNWGMNSNDLMKLAINSGAPKEKLILGIPFCGRAPTTGGKPTYASKELLLSLGVSYGGELVITYEQALEILKNKNVVSRWDNEAKVPYLTYIDPNTKSETFLIQYEDPKSVEEKALYAFENDLGGTMVWELGLDVNSILINTVGENLGLKENIEKQDVDKNGVINGEDVTKLTSKYNSKKDDGVYITEYDMNMDRIIDLYDIVIISRNINK
ncbi:MAG: glycosyl hydrolase family 18 protein, partial [Clostridium sp.]